MLPIFPNVVMIAGLLGVAGFVAGWAFRNPDKEEMETPHEQ